MSPEQEEAGLPSADELFSTGPPATRQDVTDAVLSSIGEQTPQRPARGDLPPVHDLAQELGLA